VSERPAAARWRELQLGRDIPAEIRAQAAANPWRLDPGLFRPPSEPDDTPSRAQALELLGADGGTVLDVGCGPGAAALALSTRARHLTGLDTDPAMLAAFAAGAAELGLPHTTVLGEWPAIAADAGDAGGRPIVGTADGRPIVGTADVVVCHHVVYNTTELGPFAAALGRAARRGVVVEMTAEHPLAWLDPLWERFHGLVRPRPPTVDDAVAVLAEVGIRPSVTRWQRTRRVRDAEWITRQLCLPPERAGEVAAAVDELPAGPRPVATLRW
jgi:SAM-dependent methyltransferase